MMEAASASNVGKLLADNTGLQPTRQAEGIGRQFLHSRATTSPGHKGDVNSSVTTSGVTLY